MKNVCVFVSSFHPNHSANSKCIANILENFPKDKFKIFVVNSAENYCDFEKGNITVVGGISHNLSKISRTYLRLINPYSVDNSIKTFFINSFKSIEKKYNLNIDILIPVCFPVESLTAALALKKISPGLKISPYLLDLYCFSKTAHSFKILRLIKSFFTREIEKEVFKLSDIVFINHTWEVYLRNTTFSIDINYCVIEHPLIVKPKIEQSSNFNCNFIYAGALSKKVRNPSFCLNFFQKFFSFYDDGVFHVFHNGDCNDIVSNYTSINPKILNHGYKSNSDVETVMSNSFFLVLIGNNYSDQLQSKVYEYISTGKPIIYFCANDGDPVVSVLSTYGNSLTINKFDEFEKSEKDLREFIQAKPKLLSFKEVHSLFIENTPEQCAKRIINYLVN